MEEIVFKIGPYSFTTSAFLIGLILSQHLSIEEQDSVGNWLQLIGLTMQTYASQKTTLEAVGKEEKEESSNVETLKKAVKKIEEELDKLCKKEKENKPKKEK